ncbi:LppP/LprE family lipoprotein [Mycolicibacter hiberniae]|uniref:LppP/LprE family lipoprotein n=1 Tax=Mycolicibacter hiberniae TaxID=29314 RepID=UPI001F43410F|nr:LppP/LprE family lipoprotein [Mycolicibacter hiberniae]
MPGVLGVVKPSVVIAALAAALLAGCGSGDSTVAKTPANTSPAAAPPQAPVAESPASSSPPADPCAVDLAAPAIAQAVSELPRDPRSGQPWSPEPLAGNYNTCADISAVIVKANTNSEHPGTRAVLFHRGEFLAQSVPDTYGFSGIDLAQCTPDTVALRNASGIPGIAGVVKFHWNGTGVEIVGNTTR